MTEEKNSKALKILTAVLTIGIIALGVYTMKFYNENQQTISRLENEKADLESDLSDLIIKYDTAISKNDVMAKDLYEAKQRIERLLDSIKGLDNTNYAAISRFRNQIKKLEREKDQLFKTVDSLSRQNQRLATAVDSTNSVLKERIVLTDSLVQQNEILNEKVAAGSKMQLTKLAAEGVIIKNSGDIANTKRHRRTDKIRTCFTIAKNLIAEPGEKKLYAQIINPKNNLIGDNKQEMFEEKVLMYSATTKVFYENEELDICILIDADENNIISGVYQVNIFQDADLLATTSFTLK
jgi:uncharacterized protein YoxC